MAKQDKGTAMTTGTDSQELIPQKHGGALRRGNPGNKGGGRTSNEIRELMRKPLAKLLPVIVRIAEATDTQEVTCPHCDGKHEVVSWLKARDKLQAVDLLARHGLIKEVEHQGVTIIIDAESLSC